MSTATPATTSEHSTIAIAALSHALPELGAAQAGDNVGSSHILLQLTPASDFTPSDGRPMRVAAWRINAAIAQRVIAATAAHIQPPVIDYEHQSLHKEANGQIAPAAGWMHAIEWHEGRGLMARVELTTRARELIAAGEYRYFSPVFTFDERTGEVQRILMGALTNTPAIHGMAAVSLAAAASAFFAARATAPTCNRFSTQGESMTLAEQIRAVFALDASAGDEAIVAACTAARDRSIAPPKAAHTPAPDPAQFAPITVVDELRGQIAALSAQLHERQLADLIEPALSDGRLLAAQEAWARELGKKDIAALSQYLKTAQPIAALASTQTQGRPPAGVHSPASLNAAELAVCTALGLTPEKYRAAAATTTAPVATV